MKISQDFANFDQQFLYNGCTQYIYIGGTLCIYIGWIPYLEPRELALRLGARLASRGGRRVQERLERLLHGAAGPRCSRIARSTCVLGGFVHGERADFTGLVLGCIEADFCK